MKTLNLSKIHIIASEWNCEEPIDRIYVVAKSSDGQYDDPMTCVVELDPDSVFSAVPFHQFLKFCRPVPLEISDSRLNVLMSRLLLLPIRDQLKLIWLYDPVSIGTPEEIVSSEIYDYVSENLSIPLRKEEFDIIQTGFMLHFNLSKAHEVNEFKRDIRQYMTSIENPMDRKKIDQVVELILEYLEGIGQWQRDYPF